MPCSGEGLEKGQEDEVSDDEASDDESSDAESEVASDDDSDNILR